MVLSFETDISFIEMIMLSTVFVLRVDLREYKMWHQIIGNTFHIFLLASVLRSSTISHKIKINSFDVWIRSSNQQWCKLLLYLLNFFLATFSHHSCTYFQIFQHTNGEIANLISFMIHYLLVIALLFLNCFADVDPSASRIQSVSTSRCFYQ